MNSDISILSCGQNQNSGSIIRARASIPISSEWFSGHFPNFPILPGVALLDLVREVITRICSKNDSKLNIIGLEKVRFKKLVLPGEILDLVIENLSVNDNVKVSFEVFSSEEPVCAGIIVASIHAINDD